MKVALVQCSASPDIASNVENGIQRVREAAQLGAEIICFPELAFTPFYPQYKAGDDFLSLAEPVDSPTIRRFQDLAAELGVVLILNHFERVGDKAFDSSPIIDTNGDLVGIARMIHITEYEHFHEQGYYTPGDNGINVFETAKGRIGVAICYDRHFPEQMRILGLGKPDIVFIPQAGTVGEWPEGLFEAEVRVAAFHNGYYAALANRVGVEDNLTFAGGSHISDPNGHVIARSPEGQEDLLIASIDPSVCDASHARQLFLKHRRPDVYKAISDA